MRRFCEYKDIFGKPRTGLHAIRLFDIAIVDVLLTLLLAVVISWLTRMKYGYACIISFALGIFAHWLFCVDTTVHVWLFGKN